MKFALQKAYSFDSTTVKPYEKFMNIPKISLTVGTSCRARKSAVAERERISYLLRTMYI